MVKKPPNHPVYYYIQYHHRFTQIINFPKLSLGRDGFQKNTDYALTVRIVTQRSRLLRTDNNKRYEWAAFSGWWRVGCLALPYILKFVAYSIARSRSYGTND